MVGRISQHWNNFGENKLEQSSGRANIMLFEVDRNDATTGTADIRTLVSPVQKPCPILLINFRRMGLMLNSRSWVALLGSRLIPITSSLVRPGNGCPLIKLSR